MELFFWCRTETEKQVEARLHWRTLRSGRRSGLQRVSILVFPLQSAKALTMNLGDVGGNDMLPVGGYKQFLDK